MGYERDEAMRQQEATEAMIRMREPRRPSDGPFMPCRGAIQDAATGQPLVAPVEEADGSVAFKTLESSPTTERVPFRLIQTPCCETLLCWVNPRLPNACPECGKSIYPQVRSCVLVHDPDATLRTTQYRITTRARG